MSKPTPEAIKNLLAMHGLTRVWLPNIKAWHVHRLSDGYMCAGAWTFEHSDISLEEFAARVAKLVMDPYPGADKAINWWSPK